MVKSFDKLLKDRAVGTKEDELKEFFDVEDSRDLDKVLQSYRDKVEDRKKNIDMSKAKFRKVGVNEYKVEKYVGDKTKVLPLNTVKTGKELLGNFHVYYEIEIPKFYEDAYGNIWVYEGSI